MNSAVDTLEARLGASWSAIRAARHRTASQRFRNGITRLFFDVHPTLPRLIRDFGVF